MSHTSKELLIEITSFLMMEKEVATHSSTLAWRIPGTEEPGGLPSYGVAESRTQLKRLSSSNINVHTSNNRTPKLTEFKK